VNDNEQDFNKAIGDITEEQATQMLHEMPLNNARVLSALLTILDEKGIVTDKEMEDKLNELREKEREFMRKFEQEQNGGVDIEE
jgi:16S rRNA C1402 (ribose-2'-O) methylase RsmI